MQGAHRQRPGASGSLTETKHICPDARVGIQVAACKLLVTELCLLTLHTASMETGCRAQVHASWVE